MSTDRIVPSPKKRDRPRDQKKFSFRLSMAAEPNFYVLNVYQVLTVHILEAEALRPVIFKSVVRHWLISMGTKTLEEILKWK